MIRKVLSLVLCSLAVFVRATPLPDSLLHSLHLIDELIDHRSRIHAAHEAMLDSLKREMHTAAGPQEQYRLCGSLFYEYMHYQTDSSLHYVNKREELLPQLAHLPHLQTEVTLNRAEVYGVMGNYELSLKELQRVHSGTISEDMRRYYYSVCCSYYDWVADFAFDRETKTRLRHTAALYRDSILQCLPDGANRDIVFSTLLLEKKEPDEVIRILHNLLQEGVEDKPRTYVYYGMAEAYAAKQDTLAQMYYLAQTSLMDLRMAVREYAALQELAWLIYLKGDVERAYHYAECAMQDAEDCHSRLRYVENGRFFPLINKALLKKTQEAYKASQLRLLAFLTLLILLGMALAAMAWWMWKWAKMRTKLVELNGQLLGANRKLKEEGRIKEVYIAHYLNRCVDYMEKHEQYRRQLEKLAMGSKIAELFKAIRSNKHQQETQKEFYKEFDRTFLDLFPHFVDDLNNLLVEDGQLTPRQGELLSTELRIFAIIRLGVTETNRIAHLLGCSLTTVYNYRSKVRNHAKGDKDKFEEAVATL